MIRKTFEELKATGQLPSPPGVGMRILKLTSDDSQSADEIAHTIMADSALTGRLLKIANSTQHAGAQPVTTVAEATVRLGVRAVKNVALGLSLVSTHRAGMCVNFDYDRYWSMSLARAVAAQHISHSIGFGSPSECYVLGLMGEIGYLALASAHPVEYAEILAAAGDKRGIELARLERERFEIDHSEVGAYMLEEWGLPTQLTQAVQIYEHGDAVDIPIDADAARLAHVLRHAQRLSEICFGSQPHDDSAWDEVAVSLESLRANLALDEESFSTLCDKISADWREWGDLLQVPTQKMISVDEIRERTRGVVKPLVPVDSARDDAVQALEAAISAAPPARGLRILAVDDDAMSLKLLVYTLRKSGHDVQAASNGSEALEIALETNPQVVIADWMMPEMDGLDLCKALRRIECGRNMFFLLLTGRGEEDRIVEAFDAGVDDYIVKPLNSRVLMARLKGGQRVLELQEHVENDRKIMMKQVAEMGLMTRKLRNAALTDVLTELPNRRYAIKRLEGDWEASTRTDKPLSIIMIDIDHFKKVNDTHGHDIGDVVLKETANILRTNTRQNEEASRLGGEEFLIICAGTTEAQAAICAERLRAAVEAHHIRGGTFDGRVTISLGVAQRTLVTPNFDALLKAADDAVYAAKHAGRNRFHLASAALVPCLPSITDISWKGAKSA